MNPNYILENDFYKCTSVLIAQLKCEIVLI